MGIWFFYLLNLATPPHPTTNPFSISALILTCGGGEASHPSFFFSESWSPHLLINPSCLGGQADCFQGSEHESHRSLGRHHRAVLSVKGDRAFLTKRSFDHFPPGGLIRMKSVSGVFLPWGYWQPDRSRGPNMGWWSPRCMPLSLSLICSLSFCLHASPLLLLSDFLPASIRPDSQTESVHSILSRWLLWAYYAPGTCSGHCGDPESAHTKFWVGERRWQDSIT